MRNTFGRMIVSGCLALVPLIAGSDARAGDKLIYDFFSPYLQRIEGITPGAGDAKDSNAVTHVIDPWPPYVGNRRIPGNGERMAGAMERYRDVRKLPLAPPPIPPIAIETSGLSGGGGGGGVTAAPAR